MRKTRSRTNIVEKSKPVCVIKGILWGYIFTTVMVVLLTFLLYRFDLADNQIYIGIIATYILATIISGLVTGKGIRENSWIWGSAAGFIYFLLLIIGSVIVNQELSSIREIFTMLALCIGGGTLGGMFS
ncbi:putative membrane protein (TIGR04086 family) [Natranaerovirga hydrolytica]|uniref:Putative membrane protein (TIGR04086 family) n=1 Tax=Natranaerovirga hydrolytica TaxID=680378 RepID=A0A4R1N5B2_9FIRM|nr:TIGR04086 family membrane protein [Natranaerovirga hydrolytica]TCK97793.1 putative membrane protein (TIGR04086 family) [Natranaerovirga hydrolytica]